MICPYCNKEMEIIDKHCSECGHRIYNLPVKKQSKKVEEK